MKNLKPKPLTQVKGGCALAGFTFESVGGFVFIKNEYLQSNTFAA
jgi:NADH:ubiquinone oxidoreductase subunit F (NADH-binding)